MFLCMRTTIDIHDQLFAELKHIAADSGRTLTAVIHDAVRESLSRRRTADRPVLELPVFHGTGVMPGVDLSDTASMLDLMDKEDGHCLMSTSWWRRIAMTRRRTLHAEDGLSPCSAVTRHSRFPNWS